MDLAGALALTDKLSKELDSRAAAVREADDWYEGRHPIPSPPPNTLAAIDQQARLAFQEMARNGITNLLPPIVDVQADGLTIEGFRFGASSVSADVEAQQVWQRSHMDEDHGLVIHDALRTGQGFVLVWPGPMGAEITVEDPAQTIVAYEAGSRRKRRAALKRWTDDEGYTCATLYTPTELWKFRSTSQATTALLNSAGSPMGGGDWAPREVDGEQWPLPNPHGVVPVIEVRANKKSKASLYGGGVPEFAKQLTPQRRMNAATMLLLTTMDAQAFRQRWATGWDYPVNEDGSPDREAMIRMGSARVASFAALNEGTEVKVGEFAQADFRPFVNIQGMWVKEIASTSGTPPYAFLLGDMINVAADSLARIEGIKVRKTAKHSLEVGEPLLEAVLLALRMDGNPKGLDVTASVLWAEFEQRTAMEQAQVAQIAKALGAPDEAVFAMFPGVNQTEAARWVTEKVADGFRAGLLEPTAPEPVTPEPVPVA